MKWDQLKLNEGFQGYFTEHKLKSARKVQEQVIPQMLNNSSVLVCSETGSGKSLSFALPIMELVKRKETDFVAGKNFSSPQAIILAPTRELATQLHDVFKQISYHIKLRIRLLISGNQGKRAKSLRAQEYEVLIATPSSLVQAIKRKEVKLSQCQHLVMDEVDNLLEMGFKKDIAQVLSQLDLYKVQLGLFTATFPASIHEVLLELLANKKIEQIISTGAHRVSPKVDTFNVKVSPAEKNTVVEMFLKKEAKGRGIIFANQKNQAEDLKKYLEEKMPKLKIRLLHGGLAAEEREKSIKAFREKKVQVLLATDIAARGIDVENVLWVLNYGLPKTAIYYLHRSGRVARGDSDKGIVYNLIAPHDQKMIAEINEAILGQNHLKLKKLPSK